MTSGSVRVKAQVPPETIERLGTRVSDAQLAPPPASTRGRFEQSLRDSWRRDRIQRLLLAFADSVAALVALVAVVNLLGDDSTRLQSLAAAPLVLLLHKLVGLYDRDPVVIKRSTLDEVPQLAQLAGLYTLGVVMAQPLLIDGNLGQTQIAGLWLAVSATLPAGRLVARKLLRVLAAPERCLAIGDAAHVERIVSKLAASGAHARVVAVLPSSGEEALETPQDVRWIVERLDVQRIIIAPDSPDTGSPVQLIRAAKAAGVRVSVLPRMLEAIGTSMEVETLDGMLVLGVPSFGLPRSSVAIKRVFDFAGAALGLLAIAPLLAMIAVAIRLDSRGPILFRQDRVGRDGRIFRMIKFRTMCEDADERKAELLERNEAADGFFKLERDPRVTRVGRFLRQTSLDEVPQLFNVLRGEMSLVGPRPLVRDEDVRVVGLDRARLHLTPGMTGPWQVLGSSRIPMQEMVGIDYLYVANWSLWGDVKILLQTVLHVFRRGNR
jgi:exopolysaccharide biosynthesis polyprenyl glycosylphosphotransferase